MKHLPFLLLFPLLCLSTLSSASDALYSQKIMVSADAGVEAKQLSETLAGWLNKITGKPFESIEGEAGSTDDVIQLWLTKQAREAGIEIPATLTEKLKQGNSEAFAVISTADKPGLKIIAATPLGLRHGVYWYLRELGFLSLFPGEHWQIVPQRESIRVVSEEVQAPAFLQRQYFGTGGFGPKLPLDPDGKIKKMWDDWNAANLFGSPIGLGGHYGEAFVLKHKDVFESHPEYRAMINGERAPMSSQFQINYGNKELRELYIQDRVDDMRKAVEKDVTGEKHFSVSVDPADGGGHDESPESVALGSVSDRVFGLANDVAKEIQKEFPGNFVNLYAYNVHSDVPKFPLEKNVIVSVIPYGFNQAKTLLGDDLLLAWKEKATQLGLYDYWGLPDWSRDTPTVDYLRAIPRKLKFWYANKVRYFNAETTTAAGTAGIPLLLASRIMWDPETDPQTVLTEFYDKAFGPAKAPMQRMLERWSNGFALQDNELGLSFRDLKEARDLAKSDPAVLARIGDYITYVHYLTLLREFDVASGEGERLDAANAILRFIWQIRDNAMVQTFRITQLMLNTWFKNDTLRETWDFTKPDAPGWATVPPTPTEAEQLALLEKGLKDYPVFFENMTFSTDLVPLGGSYDVDPDEENPGTIKTFRLIQGHNFLFQPKEDGEKEFTVTFGDHPKSTQRGIVTVKAEGDDKVFLFNQDYPLDGQPHTFQVSVKKGVTYRLSISDRSAHFNLRAPESLPLVTEHGFTPVAWAQVKSWFFVPKGTKRFAVFIPNNAVPDKTKMFVVGDEEIFPLSSRGGFMVYDVQEGHDGKPWQITRLVTSRRVQFYNVPDYTAFSPNTLLVPKETLK